MTSATPEKSLESLIVTAMTAEIWNAGTTPEQRTAG